MPSRNSSVRSRAISDALCGPVGEYHCDIAEEVGREHGERDVGAEDPGILSLSQQCRERLVILAAPRGDLPPALSGEHVRAAEEDGSLIDVRERGLDHVDARGANGAFDRGTRGPRGDDLVEVLLLQGQEPVVDPEEQIVLRRVVVVHRALGDAGCLDDLLHTRVRVPLSGEEGDSRLGDGIRDR